MEKVASKQMFENVLTNNGKMEPEDVLAMLDPRVLLEVPIDFQRNEVLTSLVPTVEELDEFVRRGNADSRDRAFIRICLDFHEALLQIKCNNNDCRRATAEDAKKRARLFGCMKAFYGSLSDEEFSTLDQRILAVNAQVGQMLLRHDTLNKEKATPPKIQARSLADMRRCLDYALRRTASQLGEMTDAAANEEPAMLRADVDGLVTQMKELISNNCSAVFKKRPLHCPNSLLNCLARKNTARGNGATTSCNCKVGDSKSSCCDGKLLATRGKALSYYKSIELQKTQTKISKMRRTKVAIAQTYI